MEKEKIILPIGSNKALVYESDPDNKEDQEFAKQCKEVTVIHPTSIQDFFIRLSELQKAQVAKCRKKIT